MNKMKIGQKFIFELFPNFNFFPDEDSGELNSTI